MMTHYILDEHGEPTPVDDVLEWARWFESHTEERILCRDYDERDPKKTIYVSTVFLGLDHSFTGGPPVLWETLVFGGLLDGEMVRYSSRADALAGHQEMCARVSATLTR